MDSIKLCNAIRMEFEGIFENKIPLDAFPIKIQDMILALSRQENYSIEYMMASLLVAVSTAIGNAPDFVTQKTYIFYLVDNQIFVSLCHLLLGDTKVFLTMFVRK